MNRIEDLAQRFGWATSDSYSTSRIEEPNPFIVILIAVWSPKDFFLIESCAARINSLDVQVFVFDIDSFSTQAQLQSFFKGLPVVTQTPVFALFRDGALCAFATGEDISEVPLS